MKKQLISRATIYQSLLPVLLILFQPESKGISIGNALEPVPFQLCLTPVTEKSRSIPDSMKYLGQPLPGNTAVRFAPEWLRADAEWWYHGPVAFTPELDEFFYGKFVEIVIMTRIASTVFENGQWALPQLAEFMDLFYTYNNPFFLNSGDTMWFQCSRPGAFIYRITRSSGVWDEPTPLYLQIPADLMHGLQFSLDRDETVYSELQTQTGDVNIYRWKKEGSGYAYPEMLDEMINSGGLNFCPYIDRDERFLLFSSNRQGGFGATDLFMSVRYEDDTWSEPVNLGEKINSAGDDWAPSLSPDGKYLFFLSCREGDSLYNPYWVSSGIIDSLLTVVGMREVERFGETRANLRCAPNPAFDHTTIYFDSGTSGEITFEVFSPGGSQIYFMKRGFRVPRGSNSLEIDTSQLPAGIYFCRLTENEGPSRTIKLVITR